MTDRRNFFQRLGQKTVDYWNGVDLEPTTEGWDSAAVRDNYYSNRSRRRTFIVAVPTVYGLIALAFYSNRKPTNNSQKSASSDETEITSEKNQPTKKLADLTSLLSGVSIVDEKATYDIELESCGAIVSVNYDIKTGIPSAYLTGKDKAECINVVLKEDGKGNYIIDLATTGSNLGSGFFKGDNAAACKGLYDGIKAKGFTGVGKCLDETVTKYNESIETIRKAVSLYNQFQ